MVAINNPMQCVSCDYVQEGGKFCSECGHNQLREFGPEPEVVDWFIPEDYEMPQMEFYA